MCCITGVSQACRLYKVRGEGREGGREDVLYYCGQSSLQALQGEGGSCIAGISACRLYKNILLLGNFVAGRHNL